MQLIYHDFVWECHVKDDYVREEIKIIQDKIIQRILMVLQKEIHKTCMHEIYFVCTTILVQNKLFKKYSFSF